MLNDIRKVTRGWIAGGLLTILGIGFAIWGVQGSFRLPSSDDVASGKGVAIHAQDFRNRFDQTLEQAREQTKSSITREDAVHQGLADQVLKEMISAAAVNAFAKQAGFGASNVMVAETIRETPAFRSQITGAFDRDQYRNVLARNQLTEVQFEDDVRNGLARRQLAVTAVAGLHAPASLAKLLYSYDTERRVITVAAVPPTLVGQPGEPSEADLKAFYDAHIDSFKTPELRNLTIIKARPEAFASKIAVPEDKLRQLYEFRKPSLASGEKRSFVAISTVDEATANEAARRLAAGEDPQKIAASLKAQAQPFALATKQDVPDPAIAEAVFALQKGQSTGAIHGKLSWGAAKVTEIVGGGAAPSFESVRDVLRNEYAKQEAQSLLSDAVDKFDQERSSGKSLADAAKGAGLDVVQATNVNEQGASDQGGPVAAFANAPNLLQAAFKLPVNQATDFAPTPDGGYALVRVDAISPPGTRPFAQVKPMLAPIWKSTKIGDGMRAIAESVMKAVAGGQSFAEAAKAAKLPVVATSQSIDRSATGQNSNIPLLAQAVFNAKTKQVVVAPDARGQVLLVAQVESVVREDPARNPQLFGQARAAVDQMSNNDMYFSVQNAAMKQAAVKQNGKLVAKTLGVEPDSSAAPK